MALITCPECKRTISDTAAACPGCGWKPTPGKAPDPGSMEHEGYGVGIPEERTIGQQVGRGAAIGCLVVALTLVGGCMLAVSGVDLEGDSMSGMAFSVVLAVVVGLSIGLSIQAIFLQWAAQKVGIPGANFGKALATVVLGGAVSFVLSFVLHSVPGIGPAIGFVAGFLVEAQVMVPLFGTTFGKALTAVVLAFALALVVLAGLALLLVVVFGSMLSL